MYNLFQRSIAQEATELKEKATNVEDALLDVNDFLHRLQDLAEEVRCFISSAYVIHPPPMLLVHKFTCVAMATIFPTLRGRSPSRILMSTDFMLHSAAHTFITPFPSKFS